MANARAQLREAKEIVRADLSPLYPVPNDGHAVVVLDANPTLYARIGKRPLDIVGAAASIIVLSPLMVLIAMMVRWRLGAGGVVFRQERVGVDGKPFTILKFRSMLPDRRVSQVPFVGTDRRQTHKCESDPRHTTFGRFLRATSLDELPQLFNVLRGDMSLVGPRPELVSVAAKDDFISHPRHRVRPGITGPFQVSPLRNRNRIIEGLHLDVAYVAGVSARSDAKVLAKTVLVLIGRAR